MVQLNRKTKSLHGHYLQKTSSSSSPPRRASTRIPATAPTPAPTKSTKGDEAEEDFERSPESSRASSEVGVDNGVALRDADFADIDELGTGQEGKGPLRGQAPSIIAEAGGQTRRGGDLTGDTLSSGASSSPAGKESPGSRKRKRQPKSPPSAPVATSGLLVPSSSEAPGLSQHQMDIFFPSASQKSSQRAYDRRPWNVNGNGNIHAATKKQAGSRGSNGTNDKTHAEPNKRSAPQFKTVAKAVYSSPTTESANNEAKRLRSAPKIIDSSQRQPNPKEFKRPATRASAEHSGSSSPLSSPPSSTSSITPPHAPSSPATNHINNTSPIREPDRTTTKCPICAAPVDPIHFQTFTRNSSMTWQRAQRFCASHKKRDAEALATAKNHPAKDWSTFDDQLHKHHPVILGILNGDVQSRFRTELEAKIAKGDRNLLRRPDAGLLSVSASGDADTHSDARPSLNLTNTTTPNAPPNPNPDPAPNTTTYPTARATAQITTHILTYFSSHLRDAATRDTLFLDLGVPGFVQGVLVPEVLLRCVREDLGVGEGEALRVVGVGGGGGDGSGGIGAGKLSSVGDGGVEILGGSGAGGKALVEGLVGGDGVLPRTIDDLMDVGGKNGIESEAGLEETLKAGTNGADADGDELDGAQRVAEAMSPPSHPPPSPKDTSQRLAPVTITPTKARTTRSQVLEGIIELSP